MKKNTVIAESTKRKGKVGHMRARIFTTAMVAAMSFSAVFATPALTVNAFETGNEYVDVAVGFGMDALTDFLPGGKFIMPFMDKLFGELFKSEDKGISNEDLDKKLDAINGTIEKLRDEIKTEFANVKQQMIKDKNDLEKKIVNQTVIAAKGDSLDDLLVALQGTADQLSCIMEDNTLTPQEKAIEISALIGNNAQWLKKDNFYFGAKALMNMLTTDTFANVDGFDLFETVYNYFAPKYMFSGEALDDAKPYVDRVMLLNLYASTISLQCLGAAKQVANLSEEEISALSSAERSKYYANVTTMRLVDNEIKGLYDKLLNTDRKDSVASHYKNFAEMSRTIYIDRTNTEKRVSRYFITQDREFEKGADVEKNYEEAERIARCLQMSRNNPLNEADIRHIIDYAKTAYPGKTLRQFFERIGFDMNGIGEHETLLIDCNDPDYIKGAKIYSRIWYDLDCKGVQYKGVDIDDPDMVIQERIDLYYIHQDVVFHDKYYELKWYRGGFEREYEKHGIIRFADKRYEDRRNGKGNNDNAGRTIPFTICF